MREEEEGHENIGWNLCTVSWLLIFRAGVYDSVLGFGRVRQAWCTSLLVFLCEFLFALLFLYENGRNMRGISWVRLDIKGEVGC
jgi:hypothetical protein